MIINSKDKLINNLYLYRSFIFYFTKFETNLKDSDVINIIDALNIKNRYKRIIFVIDKLCDQIDDYYKDKKTCCFKNNKCICHRKKKLEYINGCCRKCRLQSNSGCTSKNFACKMFMCSYAKENIRILNYSDLVLLKVLTPLQRLILKSDYFSSIESVSKDLCYSVLYCIPRMTINFINTLLFTKK